MNIGNVELRFNPVDPNSIKITENDRNTFIAGIKDVIDLDAVLVTSSGNINVSPCFLLLATVVDTYDRND